MKRHLSTNASIIATCHSLHERGYVSAYGGNVSVRTGNNKIVITRAKSSLDDLGEDDLVVVDMDGRVLFGTNPPSSETALHLMVYRTREDVRSVIHTHPPASTSFAYVNREIIPINPESRNYIQRIPVVPYRPVGSQELADECSEYIKNWKVLLLERHGLVSCGENIDEAYNLTELAEEMAMMNLYVRILRGQ
ncbi:class II aldolase/adducin family protein [Christensenellaceae bacterium NSJ-44]|jgi:L-fuculose-phosphate aldolase|uniref:Class II aldolase/adducin family protein n=1 Tax=Luoshenia tenuis TaxID=2763654 RepID=A0A926D2G7_9FIRM|nr:MULTISPECIES: class II aldolase/adducin family protein [Clostridia]MBC8530068.1 class II aldolase/adducin family protein [Luoshenia tenuis]SCJ72764.1 L-fuculose phosphate aldolase [uncultured Clostridium sp.]